jgi:hypothetical protein
MGSYLQIIPSFVSLKSVGATLSFTAMGSYSGVISFPSLLTIGSGGLLISVEHDTHQWESESASGNVTLL